jgi:hypothetical protein
MVIIWRLSFYQQSKLFTCAQQVHRLKQFQKCIYDKKLYPSFKYKVQSDRSKREFQTMHLCAKRKKF